MATIDDLVEDLLSFKPFGEVRDDLLAFPHSARNQLWTVEMLTSNLNHLIEDFLDSNFSSIDVFYAKWGLARQGTQPKFRVYSYTMILSLRHFRREYRYIQLYFDLMSQHVGYEVYEFFTRVRSISFEVTFSQASRFVNLDDLFLSERNWSLLASECLGFDVGQLAVLRVELRRAAHVLSQRKGESLSNHSRGGQYSLTFLLREFVGRFTAVEQQKGAEVSEELRQLSRQLLEEQAQASIVSFRPAAGEARDEEAKAAEREVLLKETQSLLQRKHRLRDATTTLLAFLSETDPIFEEARGRLLEARRTLQRARKLRADPEALAGLLDNRALAWLERGGGLACRSFAEAMRSAGAARALTPGVRELVEEERGPVRRRLAGLRAKIFDPKFRLAAQRGASGAEEMGRRLNEVFARFQNLSNEDLVLLDTVFHNYDSHNNRFEVDTILQNVSQKLFERSQLAAEALDAGESELLKSETFSPQGPQESVRSAPSNHGFGDEKRGDNKNQVKLDFLNSLKVQEQGDEQAKEENIRAEGEESLDSSRIVVEDRSPERNKDRSESRSFPVEVSETSAVEDPELAERRAKATLSLARMSGIRISKAPEGFEENAFFVKKEVDPATRASLVRLSAAPDGGIRTSISRKALGLTAAESARNSLLSPLESAALKESQPAKRSFFESRAVDSPSVEASTVKHPANFAVSEPPEPPVKAKPFAVPLFDGKQPVSSSVAEETPFMPKSSARMSKAVSIIEEEREKPAEPSPPPEPQMAAPSDQPPTKLETLPPSKPFVPAFKPKMFGLNFGAKSPASDNAEPSGTQSVSKPVEEAESRNSASRPLAQPPKVDNTPKDEARQSAKPSGQFDTFPKQENDFSNNQLLSNENPEQLEQKDNKIDSAGEKISSFRDAQIIRKSTVKRISYTESDSAKPPAEADSKKEPPIDPASNAKRISVRGPESEAAPPSNDITITANNLFAEDGSDNQNLSYQSRNSLSKDQKPTTGEGEGSDNFSRGSFGEKRDPEIQKKKSEGDLLSHDINKFRKTIDQDPANTPKIGSNREQERATLDGSSRNLGREAPGNKPGSSEIGRKPSKALIDGSLKASDRFPDEKAEKSGKNLNGSGQTYAKLASSRKELQGKLDSQRSLDRSKDQATLGSRKSTQKSLLGIKESPEGEDIKPFDPLPNVRVSQDAQRNSLKGRESQKLKESSRVSKPKEEDITAVQPIPRNSLQVESSRGSLNYSLRKGSDRAAERFSDPDEMSREVNPSLLSSQPDAQGVFLRSPEPSENMNDISNDGNKNDPDAPSPSNDPFDSFLKHEEEAKQKDPPTQGELVEAGIHDSKIYFQDQTAFNSLDDFNHGSLKSVPADGKRPTSDLGRARVESNSAATDRKDSKNPSNNDGKVDLTAKVESEDAKAKDLERKASQDRKSDPKSESFEIPRASSMLMSQTLEESIPAKAVPKEPIGDSEVLPNFSNGHYHEENALEDSQVVTNLKDHTRFNSLDNRMKLDNSTNFEDFNKELAERLNMMKSDETLKLDNSGLGDSDLSNIKRMVSTKSNAKSFRN